MINQSLFINLDKEKDITSFATVYQIKKTLNLDKKIKVGHGGTLDPFATGVLPIAINKATKALEQCLMGDKEYQFTISWGTATDSFDSTGKITHTSDNIPTKTQIQNILSQFSGMIAQMPPKFSAKKIDGKRAYQLIRNNQEVTLTPKNVTIHHINIIEHKEKQTKIYIKCSKGTYIRSIGHDMGQKLNTQSHVSQLTRIAVGNKFHIKNSISVKQLKKQIETIYQTQPETKINQELLLDILIQNNSNSILSYHI